MKAEPPTQLFTESQPESVVQDSGNTIISNRGSINSGRRLLVRTDYTVYFSEREFVVEMPALSDLSAGVRPESVEKSTTLQSPSLSIPVSISQLDDREKGEKGDEKSEEEQEKEKIRRNGRKFLRNQWEEGARGDGRVPLSEGDDMMQSSSRKIDGDTDAGTIIHKGTDRDINRGGDIISDNYSKIRNDGNDGGTRDGSSSGRKRRQLLGTSLRMTHGQMDGLARRHHGRNESRESRESRRERHKQREREWGIDGDRSTEQAREKYRNRNKQRGGGGGGWARERHGQTDTSSSSSLRYSVPVPLTGRSGSRGAIRAQEGRQAGEGEYTTVELPISLAAVMHYRYLGNRMSLALSSPPLHSSLLFFFSSLVILFVPLSLHFIPSLLLFSSSVFSTSLLLFHFILLASCFFFLEFFENYLCCFY